MDIATLRQQHDALMELAGDLAKAVADAQQPRPVASVRWRLARLLIAHLAVEDRHLYPAMVASDEPCARSTASSFKSEMGELAAVFTAYMSSWTDQRIAAEWALFCKETLAILTALGNRVERENAVLYPLVPQGWVSHVPMRGFTDLGLLPVERSAA